MSDYNYRDEIVTCPYDEAHRFKTSRMQAHVAKCKLDHLDIQKVECPFNATHVLSRSELDHHLIHCSDRAPLDRHMAQTLDQNNPFKGNTSVPTFSDPLVESDENWDLDLDAPRSNASRPPPPGAIMEPPAMSKPSERKALYRNLHRMNNETDNVDLTRIRKPAPRQPNPVEAPKANSTELKDTKTVQNQVLGQGKTRVAANFNNNTSNGISEKSYSNIVKNMSILGLGRGQSGNPVSIPQVFDDDDFPALGSGRGACMAPKQNPRTPGTKKPN